MQSALYVFVHFFLRHSSNNLSIVLNLCKVFLEGVDSVVGYYFLLAPIFLNVSSSYFFFPHRAENLILASAPDSEGEAIAWHVMEMLQQQDALSKNITIARVAFHEITESSVQNALRSPREIDKNLVNAYLTRRALDYLIGFNISPLLWKKLPGCQSAGRVQSAALALICDRETEIEKFNKKEYWTIGVEFHNSCLDSLGSKSSISSLLTHFNSQKLDRLSIWSHVDAQEIEKGISSSTFEVLATRVSKVVKNPPMPYTTSTLQQDAANKLHFTASHTMKVCPF